MNNRCDVLLELALVSFPVAQQLVQGKLLHKLDLFEPIRDRIQNGMPVLATCAGLILLSETIVNDESVYFGTLPVTVRRNAYGRQLGSFETTAPLKGYGDFPMVFIRAPYIEEVRDSAEVLASIDGHIVAVQYQNQIGLAFHPELSEDTRIHQTFLDLVTKHAEQPV